MENQTCYGCLSVKDYQPKEEHKETFEGLSETVPNQSMTIKELMQRRTAGILPDVEQEPIYDEEFDTSLYLKDFDELHELSQEASAVISDANKIRANKSKEAEKQRFDELVKAKVEEELKLAQNPPQEP